MNVLFICQLNSVRSPMAEGLLRKQLGDQVNVKSCGLTPADTDSFMLSVMKEIGVDLSGHKPLGLEDVHDESFDRIVAFTAAAKAGAEAVLEDRHPEVELWAVPNPGEGSLDVRALMNNYRAIRTNIAARLKREFG